MALSELMSLLSGIIQGSSIGPVLFLMFIDSLAKLLEYHGITANLFADDVKVYMIIKNDLDVAKLQVALDLIADWANDWQLSVSVAKCSVLKIGRSTTVNTDFRLAENVLPNVTYCRDLGVIITSDLSSTQYITEIVSKAHQRANCILRSFTSGDIGLLLRAFIVYVRPIVEYNSIIWSPVIKHDIELVEKVQRRFTKRLRGFHNMSYCDRLTKLGLHALQLCRLHFDLSFCYKIVFGLVNVNFCDFFEFSAITNTRGHKYKLFKPRCTSSLRQKFFADRVVNVWNALPSTVNFSTLTAFRNSINKVDFSAFL